MPIGAGNPDYKHKLRHSAAMNRLVGVNYTSPKRVRQVVIVRQGALTAVNAVKCLSRAYLVPTRPPIRP